MKHLMLIIILCIVASACRKQDTSATESYTPTQTGANILYCKVNGQEHVYRNKRTYLNDNGVDVSVREYADNMKAIQVSGDDVKYGDNIYMLVAVPSETSGNVVPELNAKYSISNLFYDNSLYISHIINNTGNYTFEYLIDSTHSYISFTRFDDKIVSGTFYFEANYKDSLYVIASDGFFDITR